VVPVIGTDRKTTENNKGFRNGDALTFPMRWAHIRVQHIRLLGPSEHGKSTESMELELGTVLETRRCGLLLPSCVFLSVAWPVAGTELLG
jgi:hypothetical protein